MWVALIQSVEHFKKNAVLFRGRENSPGCGRLLLDSSYNVSSFLGLQPAGRLCRLGLTSLHNFMSQLFKINPSLWVSFSFWRRTLTNTAFILTFFQQDYGFFLYSRNHLLDSQPRDANKAVLLCNDNNFLPLLHLFPRMKICIHENPRYPVLTLFHSFPLLSPSVEESGIWLPSLIK